ncbi:MAG: GDP-mannose 4,6-dehydratase [Dehalococcoidia bacterium]|nr:GDP-mannose 4,6-dehydratase [Dehalococcoidia bacterium]
MKALVTGGAGFIGSHLVDGLLARGDEVVVLDDLSVGKEDNIRHRLGSAGFEFVRGSILDEGLVRELAAVCPIIYHLAAVVGVHYVIADPLKGMKVNLRGTENILSAAFDYGAKVVLASTSEIYGKSSQLPFTEDGDRVLGSTKVGRWSYSTAKALDEHLAFAYASLGLRVSIVRYFNAYGPRLDPLGYGSVVARFINQALDGEPLTVYGDGQQTRCFTFVEDSIRGTILAGTVAGAEGEQFNLGSPGETRIADLARTIIELVGSRSPLVFVPYAQAYGERFEEPPRRVPGVQKARDLLGFEATVPLEVGLGRTIESIRQSHVREQRGT